MVIIDIYIMLVWAYQRCYRKQWKNTHDIVKIKTNAEELVSYYP